MSWYGLTFSGGGGDDLLFRVYSSLCVWSWYFAQSSWTYGHSCIHHIYWTLSGQRQGSLCLIYSIWIWCVTGVKNKITFEFYRFLHFSVRKGMPFYNKSENVVKKYDPSKKLLGKLLLNVYVLIQIFSKLHLKNFLGICYWMFKFWYEKFSKLH